MWKLFVGMVKKLKPGVVAALPILLLATFILVNVAIWWAGPWLVIAEKQPLVSSWAKGLASGFFTLLCFTFWGVAQWHKLKQIEVEYKKEQALIEDPIREFEENQERDLNSMMLNMKQSISKRNYRYALPWYLVMGIEDAGKTSLINRSGQSFVFSTVLRASGTKKKSNQHGFDWWVGDDSVLIDPAGELLTQRAFDSGNENGIDENEKRRRLWLHFVNWLDRNRSRRPLNGIVLAIDVSSLITSSTPDRKVYASIIRARIRELMEILSTRLPVYITLTKFDLIYGFEPFFRVYSKQQREDVLGFTFSLNSVSDLDNWMEEFSQEYDQLVGRINGLIPQRANESMTEEERKAVFSFTRQIAGMKSILIDFFDDALSSDQFSTAALVRGVYFTSVYQQGVPTNAFDDAASRRYGLNCAALGAQHAKNSTVFFTKKLFSNIIYPEAGLASDNFRVAKQKRRLLALSMVSGSIATALLVGTWHRYYVLNSQQSEAVLAQVSQFKEQYPMSRLLTSQQDILGPLNQIREATLEFGFFRDKPKYVSDLGLYQGHTIGPKVEETYLNLLEYRFLPLLMADVIIELEKATTQEQKLSVLRVYRMMVDKSGRHPEFVMDFFSRYWQKEYSGQSSVQEELLGHLDYAIRHTNLAGDRAAGVAAAEEVMKPYDGVIARAQAELGSMPNDQRVYRNLKLSAETVLGPGINLKNSIGPVYDLVYQERGGSPEAFAIPQMLTKKGFETFFLPESEKVSELALIDGWVLGQSQSTEFSEADKQVLRDKIRDLYVADYIATWRGAVNEIDVKSFADINDAVAVLDNLTSNTEPMQRLLRSLDTNTRSMAILPEGDSAANEVMKTPKYRVASMIQAPFSELNTMLNPLGDQPAYFNEVLGAVNELKNYLKNIQESPDVGMAALDATKARVKLLHADPIYTLQRIASGLPQPLDVIMNKLASESWYVLRQEAIKHLEVRWYEDVYRNFETKLASRYPFDETSKRDVALNDFEAFFSPEGTLNRFYDNQLKMFVEDSSVLNESSGGQSIIREEVLAQLQQAQSIQAAFFNRKGILDVNFAVEPLKLTSDKRRSVLSVDGQYVAYSHGPRSSVDLIWPNTLRDSATSKVTLVPSTRNQSPRSIHYQGPWALFRLLDKGDVVSASPTAVDLKFSVDGGSITYRIYAEEDANPFTQRLFKSFKLSKTLY